MNFQSQLYEGQQLLTEIRQIRPKYSHLLSQRELGWIITCLEEKLQHIW